MSKPKTCDMCADPAGRVETVVLQVAGRKVAKWRMCLHCRAVALQRLLGNHRRGVDFVP